MPACSRQAAGTNADSPPCLAADRPNKLGSPLGVNSMAKMHAEPLIEGISKPVSQLALGTAFYSIDSKEDMTKCGLTSDGVLPADNFPEVVRKELTTSLQTLRTDYIDVYMLHRDNQEMPVAEIMDPLNSEIANGRINAIGASNWEYRRLTEADEYAYKHGMKGCAMVSNNLSLAVPTAAFYRGLVSTDKLGERWHEETGIPLIPWSSQARGFFTGRYTPQMCDDPALASPEVENFTSRMIRVYCTDENFERLDTGILPIVLTSLFTGDSAR